MNILKSRTALILSILIVSAVALGAYLPLKAYGLDKNTLHDRSNSNVRIQNVKFSAFSKTSTSSGGSTSSTSSSSSNSGTNASSTATSADNEATKGLPTDGPIISINFDDGWLSAYQIGLPIVEAAGFKATLYMITNQVGFSDFMTKDDVLAAESRGHEIGAHTRTHPHLPTLAADQIRNEIEGSRQDLLSMGVASVSTFAYPYGEVNSTAVDVARNAGFTGARATQDGLNDATIDPYLLNSLTAGSDVTFEQIKTAIDQAAAQKKWLILSFHEIDDSSKPESVTHEQLQQIVDYIKASHIPVVTNAEGLSIVQNIH